MKKKLIKIAGYLVMLAAFVFLVKAIADRHPDFTKIRNPAASAAMGLLFILVFAAVVYFSAYPWKTVLQFIQGKRIRYGLLAPVYVKANIAKYLPGNFMHFAGRNILAAKLGFTQLDIAFSSAVEILLLLLTAVVWSLLLAFDAFKKLISQSLAYFSSHPLILAAALLLLAAALFGVIFYLIKKQLLAKYRKFFTPAFLLLCVKLFLLYSVTQLIPGGMLLLLLMVSFGCKMTAGVLALSIAAYTVSWVAGYIVPGAPGGLGVREAALILILGAAYPSDIIIMAAVLHRILSIAGDAVAFAAVPLARRIWPAEEEAVPETD